MNHAPLSMGFEYGAAYVSQTTRIASFLFFSCAHPNKQNYMSTRKSISLTTRIKYRSIGELFYGYLVNFECENLFPTN